MTRLLLDTDVFCKLGMAGLLEDTLSVIGVTKSDCCRLPALPHMLRRGVLVRRYGVEVCGALASIVQEIPVLPTSSEAWLGELTDLNDVDAGEAQLFAVAAEDTSVVLTGDKKALRTLHKLGHFCEALDGRIIVLEAILLALCERLGAETVRERIRPVAAFDTIVASCFSETNKDPMAALWSYFHSLVKEVQPLVLWSPGNGIAL